MLVMTPAARKLLRAERRRERDAIRGRMGQDRHRALVLRIVNIIRTQIAEGRLATPFGLDGPMRHAVRGKLCLEGWGWSEADEAAKHVLSECYVMLRAERPSWNEGQPDWVTHGGQLIERTRCARCHKPLQGEQKKFCSSLCASGYHMVLRNIQKADESKVLKIVVGAKRDWSP